MRLGEVVESIVCVFTERALVRCAPLRINADDHVRCIECHTAAFATENLVVRTGRTIWVSRITLSEVGQQYLIVVMPTISERIEAAGAGTVIGACERKGQPAILDLRDVSVCQSEIAGFQFNATNHNAARLSYRAPLLANVDGTENGFVDSRHIHRMRQQGELITSRRQ